MVSDIEFLERLCERMQQVGLVQSKADFSARMLGNLANTQPREMRQHQRQPVASRMFHLRDNGQQPLEFSIRQNPSLLHQNLTKGSVSMPFVMFPMSA